MQKQPRDIQSDSEPASSPEKNSQNKPSSENGAGLSRRRFLNAAAGSVGSLALASRLRADDSNATPSQQPSRRPLGANDRIRMGVIGTGGMAGHHINSFLQHCENVEFIAVCDVAETRRNNGARIAANGGSAERIRKFNAHEELLDMKEIDAVLIATPDHWHERQLIDSLQAGKDVYCEKPMSYSIAEGKNMVDAVRNTDRIVQVGQQRRSAPAIMEAKRLVDEGIIGEVSLARASWYWKRSGLPESMTLNGDLDWQRFQAPVPPEKRVDKNIVRWAHWRYFWEYSGGNMTDQGTHLIDVIQWFLNDSQPPKAAQSYGAVYQLAGYETPDTLCAMFEYPKCMATFTLTYTNNYENGWSIWLQGSEGTLRMTNNGCRFYSNDWPHDWQDDRPKPIKVIEGDLSVAPHEKNFVDCMRSRKQPNCPVEIGHQAVSALHLANAAHHAKQRAILDQDGVTIRFNG